MCGIQPLAIRIRHPFAPPTPIVGDSLIDVILEARQLAAERIRYLLEGGCSSEPVRELECEFYGAASIPSRLGHAEAVEILSRIITDLPSVPRLGFAGDREIGELGTLLARMEEGIDKQRSLTTRPQGRCRDEWSICDRFNASGSGTGGWRRERGFPNRVIHSNGG